MAPAQPVPTATEADTYRAVIATLFPYGPDSDRYRDVEFSPSTDSHRPHCALPEDTYTGWTLSFTHDGTRHDVRHDDAMRAARTIARRRQAQFDDATSYHCRMMGVPDPERRATAVRVFDRRHADLVVQMAAFGTIRLPEIVMNTYAWIVDSTLVDDPERDDKLIEAPPEDSRNGTTGPHDAPTDLLHRLIVRGGGRRWRTLYDPDYPDHPAELRIVHTGRYLDLTDLLRPGDDPDHAAAGDAAVDPNSEFGPLDDLSKPDCGATDIQYQQPDGTWRTL